MKTLKEMIESKEVVPDSELAKLKADIWILWCGVVIKAGCYVHLVVR
jgi:hypothetical protein